MSACGPGPDQRQDRFLSRELTWPSHMEPSAARFSTQIRISECNSRPSPCAITPLDPAFEPDRMMGRTALLVKDGVSTPRVALQGQSPFFQMGNESAIRPSYFRTLALVNPQEGTAPFRLKGRAFSSAISTTFRLIGSSSPCMILPAQRPCRAAPSPSLLQGGGFNRGCSFIFCSGDHHFPALSAYFPGSNPIICLMFSMVLSTLRPSRPSAQYLHRTARPRCSGGDHVRAPSVLVTARDITSASTKFASRLSPAHTSASSRTLFAPLRGDEIKGDQNRSDDLVMSMNSTISIVRLRSGDTDASSSSVIGRYLSGAIS